MASYSHKLSLIALVSFVALSTLTSPSAAQNSATDYVSCHNTSRSQVSVGPVTWDATLATYALNYANQRKSDCALTHSNGPYGENLAKGSSNTFTGVSAVNMWTEEKPNYNYASNTCNQGTQCLHYTQVVWTSSTKIGCARVQCTNGWYYVICSYDPPGNWAGERPY